MRVEFTIEGSPVDVRIVAYFPISKSWSSNADLLRRSWTCGFCTMSDLKYQKGEWYHVQEDGTLKSVDYDKEVEEYYKKWRDNYGN